MHSLSLNVDHYPFDLDAHAPIGIFDSGIGGLSVAMEVLKHLPHERILYYADTAHVPYGCRTDNEIRDLTVNAVHWLYQHGCKMAVVACNSASAFSLTQLRQQFGIQFPIVGLVPAVKPAVIHSRTKVVAVLATAATFRGQLLQKVIDDFAVPAGVTVLKIAAPELVPLIEQGKSNSPECKDVLSNILQPALTAGADHIVLGCTHYPFLASTINQVYPKQFILTDSGSAVARQCGRILASYQCLARSTPQYRLELVCSGKDCIERQSVVQQLVGHQANWLFRNCDLK